MSESAEKLSDRMPDGTEKIVEQGLLFSYYGELLTEHQQEVYRKAVYENLSLNEIAEAEGISKQAVHDLIKRCTATLMAYEEKLRLIEITEEVNEQADRILQAAADEKDLKTLAGKAAAAAHRIQEQLS